MQGHNEKMILSGGIVNRRFFEEAFSLTDSENQNVVIDLSATTDREHFDQKRQNLSTFFQNHFNLSLEWLQPEFGQSHSPKDTRSMLASASLLYVGGGSTRRLLKAWDTSITKQVTQRVKDEKLVFSGASAGALAPFLQAHSDSRQYEVPEGYRWNYVLLKGLGMLSMWATVHHDQIDSMGRKRQKAFVSTLKSHRFHWETAVGIDHAAALICANGMLQAISLRGENREKPPTAYLYRSTWQPMHARPIRPGESFDIID